MSTQTLTPSEETLLASLVAQYREADTAETAANAQLKQAWRQKGAALIEINESRLYRQTHETFEAFVADVFGIKDRERAYQLMRAEEGALMAEAVGLVMKNESQARALREVPESKRADVLNIVHAKQEAGEKITAQTIQQAGASVTSTATEPQPNVKKVSQLPKKLDRERIEKILADDAEQLIALVERCPHEAEAIEETLLWTLEQIGERVINRNPKHATEFATRLHKLANQFELQPTH